MFSNSNNLNDAWCTSFADIIQVSKAIKLNI